MQTVTFANLDDAAAARLLAFARRNGLSGSKTAEVLSSSSDIATRQQRFEALFGAWQADEMTGDELNQFLRDSRHSSEREIGL